VGVIQNDSEFRIEVSLEPHSLFIAPRGGWPWWKSRTLSFTPHFGEIVRFTCRPTRIRNFFTRDWFRDIELQRDYYQH
jgi:hypothetical protein